MRMKVNDHVKNEEHLRKQRLYKMEYLKQMKAKHIESQEPSVSTSTTAEEGFSQRSTLMWSLQKAEKVLPKSPWKQRAVVTSLAKKSDLRISPQPSSRGWKRQNLTDDERSWLPEFLGRHKITNVSLGKNDQVYMEKVTGQNHFRQKKYFMWKLNDELDIANECYVTNESWYFRRCFWQKIIFSSDDFITLNKEYV